MDLKSTKIHEFITSYEFFLPRKIWRHKDLGTWRRERFWWIFVSSMQQKTGSFISWNPSLWSGFLGYDHLGEHEVCVNFDKWKLVLQIDSEERTKYLSTALDLSFCISVGFHQNPWKIFERNVTNWSKSSTRSKAKDAWTRSQRKETSQRRGYSLET